MPIPNLDLSSVQLPPENANEKVVINPDAVDEGYTGAAPADGGGTIETKELISSLGDEYQPHEPEKKAEVTPPADPAKPAEEKKEEAAPAVDPAKPVDPNAPTPPPTPDPAKEKEAADAKAADDKKKEEELTAFHKHPDWVKREEKLRELELENAKLKGAQEVLQKTPEQKAEEAKADQKSAAQIADERFRQKVADGWNPKDRAEELRVHGEMLEEEWDKKQLSRAEEQRKAAELINEQRTTLATTITTAIDDTFKELKVENEDQQNLVANRVNEWKKNGLFQVTPANVGEALKIAHQQLVAEGKFAAPAAPAPVVQQTPEEKAAADKLAADAKAEKDKANRMIGKPTSSDAAPNSKPVRDYKKEGRQDLDSIVFEQSKRLG